MYHNKTRNYGKMVNFENNLKYKNNHGFEKILRLKEFKETHFENSFEKKISFAEKITKFYILLKRILE